MDKIKITDCLLHPHMWIQQNLIAFDVSDYEWTRVNDMIPNKRIFSYKDKSAIRNPFTWKLLKYSTTLSRWLQADEKDCSYLIEFRNKCILPRIPSKIKTEVHEIPTKRNKKPNDESYKNATKWSSLISSISNNLRMPINRNIISLSMKDSHCKACDFDVIGSALPYTQITKLNIAGNMFDDRSDHPFANILTNGYKLHYLNISYCGYLSDKEEAYLLHLIHTSTVLHTLKLLFTQLDITITSLEFMQYCALSNTIKSLSCSLFDGTIREYGLITKKLGNISVLSVTDSSSDKIVEIHYNEFVESIDQLQDTAMQIIQSYIDIFVTINGSTITTHDKKKLKNTKKSSLSLRQKYDLKNEVRNRPLERCTQCASCGVVWQAGSIKLQTFQGLQSKCRHTSRKCCDSYHYNNLLSLPICSCSVCSSV